MKRLYTLLPERRTLHGVLSEYLVPALTVESGDYVSISTLEADWRMRDTGALSTGEGDFFPEREEADVGHALIGPIAVRGARPGQTLAATIHSLVPDNWGWSRVGGHGDPDHAAKAHIDGDEYFLRWHIDAERRCCVSSGGHRVSLAPFFGVLAVAPRGTVRTHIPGAHGGNLDCKALVAGSTIYLPVFADDALFSAGDGHAAQGDGESGGTAIECPMKEALIELNVLDKATRFPYASTPEGWVTFGFSEDLTAAAYEALNAAVELIMLLGNIPSSKEALSIFSVCGDLRITQIVNGIRGVHAVIPRIDQGNVRYR